MFLIIEKRENGGTCWQIDTFMFSDVLDVNDSRYFSVWSLKLDFLLATSKLHVVCTLTRLDLISIGVAIKMKQIARNITVSLHVLHYNGYSPGCITLLTRTNYTFSQYNWTNFRSVWFWFWHFLPWVVLFEIKVTLFYSKALNLPMFDHTRIRSWNQPVLSNEGKVSC